MPTDGKMQFKQMLHSLKWRETLKTLGIFSNNNSFDILSLLIVKLEE